MNQNERMTNHQKTVLVEELFGDYNLWENILANIGLEMIVITARAEKKGIKVTSTDETKRDFPLSGNDYS